MRELLRDMPAGVPADSLLARIRGRRAFLVHDWDRLLPPRVPATLPPAPWRAHPSGVEGWALHALQQEYYWVFSRMDERLRRSSSPFFWLAELHTLAVCLRLLAGDAADLDPLLKNSLLAADIRKALREAGGCAPAVASVAGILAGCDSAFAGLEGIYRTGGPGALEAALYEISLQRLSGCPIHPHMRRYCKLMIDSRNLTTVAKLLRWRLGSVPSLLEGGTVAPSRLFGLFEQRNSSGLLHLAMRLGGQALYSETAALEQVLYEAQLRVMRRMAREADGIGAILDYLWRCGNEAANIGLLERLESAGSAHVAEELRR